MVLTAQALRVSTILASPALFYRWWSMRQPQELDQAIRAAALEAGYIARIGDCLGVTDAGLAHMLKRLEGSSQ